MKIHAILNKSTTIEEVSEVTSVLKLENVNWGRAARFRILSGDTDLTTFENVPRCVEKIELDETKTVLYLSDQLI